MTASHDFNDPERIAERAAKIGALCDELVGPVGAVSPYSDLSLVGRALLLRAAGTLATLTRLLPDAPSSDAGILLRSLFEHVLVFAWLAADPEPRVPDWAAGDDAKRLSMHRDFDDWSGLPTLEPSEMQLLEAEARRLPVPLSDMAPESDAHWEPRIPALASRELVSFRTTYTTLYRFASMSVHPSLLGVWLCSDGRGEQWAVRREPAGARTYIGAAPAILAKGLLIAAEVFGAPDGDAVLAAIATS